MSKSFTVDLSHYNVCRTVVNKETPLERKIDLNDVVSVLMDEGFNNFKDSRFIYRKIYGHETNNFRESIIGATMGIPRHAVVNFIRMGKSRTLLTVQFNF